MNIKRLLFNPNAQDRFTIAWWNAIACVLMIVLTVLTLSGGHWVVAIFDAFLAVWNFISYKINWGIYQELTNEQPPLDKE